MTTFQRIIARSSLAVAAASAIAATTLGAGQATAAPHHAEPHAISVNIPSQWLFLADPFPFGVENITVTRSAPGMLRFTLGPYCATAGDAIRRAPFPRCSGGPIDPPANLAWINLSTGATGTLALRVSAGDLQPTATAHTGPGLIAIAGALQRFGAPAVATIQA